MTRQELDDLLVDYLYDELEPARRAAFEEGLAEHPELAAEVEAHQRTRATAADLPRLPLPAGLLDDVLAEAGRVATARAAAAAKGLGLLERLAKLLLQPAFGSAALAVVILGIGIIYVAQSPTGTNDPDRQRLSPVVASHPGPEPAAGDQLVKRAKAQAEEAPPEVAAAPDPDPSAVGSDAPAEEAPRAAAKGAGEKAEGGEADGAARPEEKVKEPEEGAKRVVGGQPPAPRVAKPTTGGAAPPAARAKEDIKALLDAGGSTFSLQGFAGDGDDAKAAGGRAPGALGAASGSGDGEATGASRGAGTAAPAPPAAPSPAKKDASPPSPSAGSAPPAAEPVSPAADKPLREVPIAVPSERDRERAVKTADRTGEAQEAPAKPPARTSAAGPTPRDDRAADEAAAPPAPEDGADYEQSEVESARTTSSRSERAAQRAAERAEELRRQQEEARITDLWQRYDRYLAAERWSDAEEALDQLARFPSQAERVRALRPQLAKRKASVDAERASKQQQLKQPAIDSYKYK